MDEKKKCILCGRLFIPALGKRCCSDDCERILKRLSEQAGSEKAEPENLVKSGLLEDVRKAVEMGLSYGKYIPLKQDVHKCDNEM